MALLISMILRREQFLWNLTIKVDGADMRVRLGTIARVLAAAILVSILISSVAAQRSPVNVKVDVTQPLQIGQINITTVTITDVSNTTVQLFFVGIHFEWDTVWYIGGHSAEGALLNPNEQISYTISIGVPANATAGVHKLYTIVKCRWLQGGNWTSEYDQYWVEDVQVGGTSTTQSTPTGPSQTLPPNAIILIISATAIGLLLERHRIRQALGKLKKREDEPAGEL
jgi:hypothetical protein